MVRRTFAYLLTGACLAAFAAQVNAQNNTAPASQPDSNQIDTDPNAIIITATKRSQVLIDVPQSITVVSG
jgi:outer membrane receptor protein involved in Fe transport